MTQLLRYAVVGGATNLAGYLLYLLATSLGAGPKTTMTVLYLLAAGSSFLLNRRWTFGHRGRVDASLARYGLAHAGAYALNFALLAVLVDRLGYPHQAVQALAVIVVAGFLFAAMRLFVFPQGRPGARA